MSTSTQILVEKASTQDVFEVLPETTCIDVNLIQCHRSEDEIYGIAIVNGFPPQDVVNEISYSVTKNYFHAYYLTEDEEAAPVDEDRILMRMSIDDITSLDEDDLKRIIRYATV